MVDPTLVIGRAPPQEPDKKKPAENTIENAAPVDMLYEVTYECVDGKKGVMTIHLGTTNGNVPSKYDVNTLCSKKGVKTWRVSWRSVYKKD